MSLKRRLFEHLSSLPPDHLVQKAARLVFGAVFPFFVWWQFTTQGMTFSASLISLLTMLALVFTIISLDTLVMRSWFEDE